MKVVLHIGVEKTGTTSIQEFLSINSRMLNSHKAIYYGGRVLGNLNQSSELVLSSVTQVGAYLNKMRVGTFKGFRDTVKAEIATTLDLAGQRGVTQVIFSSEHMSSRMRNQQEVQLLKNLFPGDVEFEIVAYCRRQDQLYLGTLAEGIKAGTVSQLTVDEQIALEEGFYSRGYYDYEALLGLWAAVFGKENIRVNAFEPTQLKSGDIVADFLFNVLRVKNLSDWKFPPIRRLNRRHSAEFLYFLSCFNTSCSHEDRDNLLEHAERIDTFKSNSFIPVARLADFLDSFEESNNLVAKKYLGQETLFTRNKISTDEYVVADTDSLSSSSRKIKRRIANLSQAELTKDYNKMPRHEDVANPLSPLKWILVHGNPRCGTGFMARMVKHACSRFVGDWGLRNLLKEVTQNNHAKLDVPRLLTEISNNILANAEPGNGTQYELVFKQAVLFHDEYRILERIWGKPDKIIYCFRSPDEYIHSAIIKYPRSTQERLQHLYENQLQRLRLTGGECFEYHGKLTVEDYLKFLEPIKIERSNLEPFVHKGVKDSAKVTAGMWGVYKELLEMARLASA